MDESDMTFVNQTLPALKIQIKEDKFEQIVDRLEKESFKLVSLLAVVVLLPWCLNDLKYCGFLSCGGRH